MVGLGNARMAGTLLIWLCLASSLVADEVLLPCVDKCRTVYVCEVGTKVLQLPDGTVCIDDQERILNDPGRQYYNGLARPFDARRLRDITESLDDPGLGIFQGVDANGHAWFCDGYSSKHGLRMACVQGRTCFRQSFGKGYSGGPDPSAHAFGWSAKGRNSLCDRQGQIWVVGLKSLYRLGNKLADKPVEIPFPIPENADDAKDLLGTGRNMSCLGHQVYSFGGAVWVVRSMTSNCKHCGTFIVRFSVGTSTIMACLREQYVNALVRHGGDVYAFIESESKNKDRTFSPRHILRFRLIEPAARPAERIRQKIDALDSDKWTVRDEATKWLSELPTAQVKLLQEAMAKPRSMEQQVRLEKAIAAIASRSGEAKVGELEGFRQARLLYVDRAGRQYVQAWGDNGGQSRMLVLDGKTSVSVKLPSTEFAIGCQDADGIIYAWDKKRIYSISKNLEIQPIASLGTLAGSNVQVLAAQKGLVCIGVPHDRQRSQPIWLDLKATSTIPVLPGKVIADGVAMTSNRSKSYQLAVGPKDSLWFVRYKRATGKPRESSPSTQLLRALGDKVETLSGDLPTSVDPSVWPLAEDTAIVSTQWDFRQHGVIWYHKGEAQVYSSLKELLEAQHVQIAKVAADPVVFTGGDNWEKVWFVRVGESFYVEDYIDVQRNNGGGRVDRSMLMRKGKWVEERQHSIGSGKDWEPLLNRLIDLDANSGRVLAFQESWKTLRWVDLAKGGPAEDIQSLQRGWAWRHLNRTHLPRFAGSWMMTPPAGKRWAKLYDQRIEASRKRGIELDTCFLKYKSDDFAAFRRWDGGKWRSLNHSIYGTAIFQDAAGGVWQFCSRHAKVSFPGRPDQTIPLDAGHAEDFRLVIESPDAVWVASQESLWRLGLVRDATDKPMRWEVTKQFRLPRGGLKFAGPWIAGRSLYYLSNSALHHVALGDLTGT